MSRLAWIPLVLVSVALADDPPRFARTIALQAPGRVAVGRDRAVYAEARADLADLRVQDDVGTLVPFVIDCDPGGPPRRLSPRVSNRAFVAGRVATATLDFGERIRKSALRLSLPGDNFRRRVVVEGGNDGRVFETLVDDAWVFAIPGAPGSRYERVALPEGDHRYLRVTVHLGPEDPKRIEIGDVSAEGDIGRPAPGRPLRLPMRRIENAERQETLLVCDLPGARHPFRDVRIEVATPSFLRSVVVEAQRVPPPPVGRREGEPRLEVGWQPLGEGVVYRYESGGRLYENLTVSASGRERRLRLRIFNRDDAPLEIRGGSIFVPRERVLFVAAPGRAYRLSYGSQRATAPSFDLQRTVGDPRAWAASAGEGGLGPPLRTDARSAAQRPWTERHPSLLWAGLVFVALALGALTWRALRDA